MFVNGGELNGTRLLKSETVQMMTRNQLPESAVPIQLGQVKRDGIGFGLGFSVRIETPPLVSPRALGEYGWGGAASTHYWVSPKDKLVVVTMEQVLPYQWDTEFGVKKTIYEAIKK